MNVDPVKVLCTCIVFEYITADPCTAIVACLKPGDKFLGLDLSHGGHLSHGSAVNSSGILYNPVAYGVDEDTGTVNYDKMEEIALKEKPKLILAGASAYSRDWDFERMRDSSREVYNEMLEQGNKFFKEKWPKLDYIETTELVE